MNLPPIPGKPSEPQKIMHPDLKCPTCQRPRELKVDKFATLAGAIKGVRIRPMAVHRNKGRTNRRLRKRDPRNVQYY